MAEECTHRMPDIIAQKRDGGELSPAQIKWFIANMLHGSDVDDSQIGALLMAIYLKGLSKSETLALTETMRDSGEVLDWPTEWQESLVDKHSTGGIGDKVSLPLAPALAACGMKVPMISGRGLGHTGGTLDKLESIPGYNVMASKERMTTILKEVGCCIVGQTSNLVPADKKLYATRDVTATVGSLPLITASIVSKKAAEKVNSLVLDVKVGRAAHMRTIEEGRELAESMVFASNHLGVKATAFLTAMSTPIGNAIGNALEVAEALQCLQGGGPDDLKELVCKLGGQLLYNSGKVSTPDEGIGAINDSLQNGSACHKFQAMLVSQGVSSEVAERLCTNRMDSVDDAWKVLKRSTYTTELKAKRSGYVEDLDAMELGMVTLQMGAGRIVAGADIDHAVGLRLLVQVGSKIQKDESWICVYHNSALSEDQVIRLQSALTIGPNEVPPPPSRIHEIVA
ncbi:thymidine phosphorylase-like [Acanthaster planci]|uniref:Thymidine phosphorylase n=1 Tax=Acanthaster planci TaxID=133434 RepID=A0A8B7ZRI2_ACAPL|nr:thymidine phosphorylase-like [Acanthaster planci]